MLTRPITREQIAAAVGNNPRAIRLIEQLVGDVTETIPQSLSDVSLGNLLSAPPGAAADANSALQAVRELGALLATDRRPAETQALQNQIDALRLEVHMLRAQMGSAIQQLTARVNDAQALTIGV